MRRNFALILILLPLAASFLALGGCASKGYVREELAGVHSRVDSVEDQVESNQTRLDEQSGRLDEQGEQITAVSGRLENASQTAKDALERAVKAGKLAEGKLLYETTLSDDRVKFGFDTARLSPEATAALDEFATELVAANESVFIEIQGHTDATGEEDYNLELGFKRAESVLRYLNMRHGLPLHRMSAISYGETAPVADNTTREGRAQNRRVVLVVLK